LNRRRIAILSLIGMILVTGCTRPQQGAQPWRPVAGESSLDDAAATQVVQNASRRAPGAPVLTPTPDPPRDLPPIRQETEEYTVQSNDTLGQIAQRYGVALDRLVEANDLLNPDLLEVGDTLTIPAPEPLPPGPSFKILPDSELVYSPATVGFDTADFLSELGGYITRYEEELDGRIFDGPAIIDRVAMEYSVNPRLLLAVLEYRSGWVTSAQPAEDSREYPLLYTDPRRKGLYRQMIWAANNLNRGYYLWRVSGISSWLLQDGAVVPVNPIINAGTAGVQHFFSLLLNTSEWRRAVTEEGFFATYSHLFGYPFDYAIEPLVPPDLQQPQMQLPFEAGQVWSFTGGPHGGWGDGSAWSALDFGPPGQPQGCIMNEAFSAAVADGKIIRSDLGAVVQDLDGDGIEQTGWTILYLHVDSQDRVQAGTEVRAGDRIGHPSCEGGVSYATHLHIARRYNGEWISADSTVPFVMDGWVSKGEGVEYNGFLVKDDSTIVAWNERRPENQISR
jgi:murein DD-endopeptidase MepM/ murein hydrolase activator NlpD